MLAHIESFDLKQLMILSSNVFSCASYNAVVIYLRLCVFNPLFFWKHSLPGENTVTVTIPKEQCPPPPKKKKRSMLPCSGTLLFQNGYCITVSVYGYECSKRIRGIYCFWSTRNTKGRNGLHIRFHLKSRQKKQRLNANVTTTIIWLCVTMSLTS